MNLTATIRDESGAVVCAYPLRHTESGALYLAGHDALELEGVTYRVTTRLEPDSNANRERMALEDGLQECGRCGAAMPFEGFGVWSECPVCGNRQRMDAPGRQEGRAQ